MRKLRRDTISEDDYSPLDAGWDALLDGKRLSSNPYAINNWKHYEWETGWKLAENAVQGDDAPDRKTDG